MNRVYPSAVDAVIGALDLTTAALKLQLVGAYVYDDAHTARADLTHTIGVPAAVTINTITAGAVTLNPLTFPAVPGTDPVLAAVLYVDDTGTDPLIAYYDQRGDLVPIDLVTGAGTYGYTFAWTDPALTF